LVVVKRLLKFCLHFFSSLLRGSSHELNRVQIRPLDGIIS